MNEDFNTDGHGIDQLFRESLGDYSEIPGDKSWGRLNSKLNRKEIMDFVKFKKTKISPELMALVPIYRKQWFRLTIFGSVIVPALFFTGYFIARNTTNNDKTNLPISEQRFAETQYPNSLTEDQGFRNVTPLDQNNTTQPGNNTNKNIALLTPIQQNDKNQSSTNNRNNTIIKPVFSNSVEDLANDPVIMNSLQHMGVTTEKLAERYEAARIVDSIIQANAINENQIYSNDSRNGLDHQLDELPVNDNNNSHNAGNDPIIIIPSAFTPNYDGLNDVLFIDGLEFYPENTFVVHDVKGNIIYSKKEYRGDWNAEGVPDGLYFYFLTYKDRRNVTITIKGVVTIIR